METNERLLINREKVGNFKFDSIDNVTDVFYKGNADDGCREIAITLGIENELDDRFISLKEQIEKENSKE